MLLSWSHAGSCFCSLQSGVHRSLPYTLLTVLFCRCKTLDASADGYVRAEAVGCAMLVPAAAVPDSMQPSMVLLSGSAVNQDGRSSSLTAPNGPSQQSVIRQALQAGSVAGGQVAQVQMHGTGTPLGGKLLSL